MEAIERERHWPSGETEDSLIDSETARLMKDLGVRMPGRPIFPFRIPTIPDILAKLGFR